MDARATKSVIGRVKALAHVVNPVKAFIHAVNRVKAFAQQEARDLATASKLRRSCGLIVFIIVKRLGLRYAASFYS